VTSDLLRAERKWQAPPCDLKHGDLLQQLRVQARVVLDVHKPERVARTAGIDQSTNILPRLVQIP
jgi:hypothetical protein